MNNPYSKYNTETRSDYLNFLSESTGVDSEVVERIADELGPDKDFTILPYELEKYKLQCWEEWEEYEDGKNL